MFSRYRKNDELFIIIFDWWYSNANSLNLFLFGPKKRKKKKRYENKVVKGDDDDKLSISCHTLCAR